MRPRRLRTGRPRRLGARSPLFVRALCVATIVLPVLPVSGEDREDDARLSGYLQLWCTMWEQVENGVRQAGSGDEAPDEASGFSLRRARVDGLLTRSGVRGRIGVRLEGDSPGLLDATIAVSLAAERLELWVGQMKIPSTFEVLTSTSNLDFAAPSVFSARVADYSLSRSPSLSHPRFYGVRTYSRDLGIAARGAVHNGTYFLMIGNGLGANRFIGGSDTKHEVLANSAGAYFYGARLTYDPLPAPADPEQRPQLLSIRLGGHFNWNRHPDILLDDQRTIVDIQRRSWSLDAHAGFGGRVRITGMIGEGVVEDDFDQDGKDDYRYQGWEVRAVGELVAGKLEVGGRYDVFSDERYENGFVDDHHTATAAVTYWPRSHLRVRLDFRHRVLESDTEPDLADDVLILACQLRY